MPLVIPVQPVIPWGVSLSLGHVIAFSSTVYRISYRYRIKRLWWDDYFATVAQLFALPYAMILWPRLKLNNSKRTQIMFYFMASVCYFSILWCARISMALSIARIFPPGEIRRYTIAMAIGFGTIGLGLVLQLSIVCGTDTSWHQTPGTHCHGTQWVSSFAGDMTGDLLLIFTPLVLVWRIRLAQNARRLILGIFGASVLTVIASVFLHVLILDPTRFGPGAGLLVYLLANVETCVCLFVCNLLVSASVLYRLIRRRKARTTEDHGNSSSRTADATTLTDVVDGTGNQRTETYALDLTDISDAMPSELYTSHHWDPEYTQRSKSQHHTDDNLTSTADSQPHSDEGSARNDEASGSQESSRT
ncbi:hypothetical protein K435DRAFT_969873 [Dendrothele bispora CBS 962.96]|uniref:Rhodopsin domain-containing protein n=1 Tax=Dendrothele bispora (strain CBS 962.96) TaxID=1314807 RepID=A0A4S8LFC6_DENBC|nr:hypothetical protein K435DRAFT_969873 [Dendrothele bispora CBS 962.96]